MNSRSKKNKGNRFENHLIEQFRQIDAKAQRTYGSGNGLDKQDVRLPQFNLEIEAKNQKTVKLIEWWEQCKRQRTAGNTGVLAIRHPKKPEFEETLIVMDIADFMELLSHSKDEVEVNATFTGDDKWKIRKLIQALKDVEKIIT